MWCLRACLALLLLGLAFAKIAQQQNGPNVVEQIFRSDDSANVEVIHENIAERFLGSLGGIIVGVLAIFLGSALLFWNEGRTLHTRRALSEAQRVCVEASPDSPLPANEGKLVHMNGYAAAKEEYLSDPLFYVAAGGCIKLRRVVEMYQWTERSERNTQKHLGGGQTTVKKYNYQTEWSQNLVDSSRFYNARDHVNPKDMRGFSSEEFVTSEVRVGAFTVPRAMVSAFNNYQNLPLDMNRLNAINPTCRPSHTLGEYVYYASGEPLHPAVGDVRVSWQYVAGGPVSIVARQAGASFAPFEYAGATVQLLETGNKTAAEQFSSASLSNKVFTWVLRVFGFVVIWVGFAISFEPIGVVFDVIPFLGDVARLGTGLFAFSAGLVLTLLVVSVAWLFYRPLKALAIFAVAGALLYFTSQQGRAVAAGSRR